MLTAIATNDQPGINTTSPNTTIERQKTVLKNAQDPFNSSWVGYGPKAIEENQEIENPIVRSATIPEVTLPESGQQVKILAEIMPEGSIIFNPDNTPITPKLEPKKDEPIPESAYNWILKSPTMKDGNVLEVEPDRNRNGKTAIPSVFQQSFNPDPAHSLDPSIAVNSMQDSVKIPTISNLKPLNTTEVLSQAEGIIADAVKETEADRRKLEIIKMLENYNSSELQAGIAENTEKKPNPVADFIATTKDVMPNAKVETAQITEAKLQKAERLDILMLVFGGIGNEVLKVAGKAGEMRIFGTAMKDLVKNIVGEKPDNRTEDQIKKEQEKKAEAKKAASYSNFQANARQSESKRSHESKVDFISSLMNRLMGRTVSVDELNALNKINERGEATVRKVADASIAERQLKEQKENQANDVASAIANVGSAKGRDGDMRLDHANERTGGGTVITTAG